MVVDIRANPARWWKRRSRRGVRAPLALFVGTFRRVISVTILAGLVIIVVAVWYLTNSDRICRLSEVLLASVTGGQVSVANGHLSLSGTLVLTGVSLQTPKSNSESATPHTLPLFSAEQIELRFDWFSLLTGSLHATQLTAVHPTLYLIEDREEGRWNYEMLHPKHTETKPAAPKAPPKSLPVILLRDARVQWGEWSNNHLIQTADTVIEGQLAPTIENPTMFRFQFAQRLPAHVIPVEPSPSTGEAVSGATTDAGIVLTGAWDLASSRLEATIRSIEFSDLLRRALPRPVRNWWDEHKLAGRLEQLAITYDEHGLRVGVDAQDISMVQQVTPPGGDSLNVNLNHVSGSFLFSNAPTSLHIAHLRGQVLGFNFLIDGDLDFTSKQSPFDLRVRFPHATLTQPYPPLFMAFHESQDLMQRTQPLGTMDLDIKVHRNAGEKNLQVNGDIFCRGSQMRFAPLPFPLRDVNGHIEFNEKQFAFRHVTALADENPVLINGSAGTTPTNCFIDFAVSCDHASFDDRMGAALPSQFQGVWNAFSITALGSFMCHVNRPNDPNVDPKIDVTVNVVDGKGFIRALPYQFSHADGKIHFTSDQTDIQNLTLRAGPHNEGFVTLNGIIKHPHGDVGALQPSLQVRASLPITMQLLHALPEKFTSRLEGVQLGGTLLYDGTVGSSGAVSLEANAESRTTFVGSVKVREGTLNVPSKGIVFNDISTDATISTDAISVKTLAATSPEGLHLSGTGDFSLSDAPGKAILLVHSDSLTLPKEPFAYLPPTAKTLWSTWHPAGATAIDATLTVNINSKDATSDLLSAYTVTLHPLKLSLRNPAYPPIDNITGTLNITPERISFIDLAAATGPFNFTLNGGLLPNSGAATITAVGEAKNITPEWLASLPAPIGPQVAAHPFSGSITLRRMSLSRVDSAAPWLFETQVLANSFSATEPFSIKGEDLQFDLNGSYKNNFRFTGRLDGKTLTLADRPIHAITANITYSPIEYQLHVSDINGSVSNGLLTADLLLTTQPDPTLALTANIKDAVLSGLMNPGVEKTENANEGTLTGALSLTQTFGPAGTRTGTGDVTIRDAKLYNVPFAMGLLQIATLRLPTASAFSHATMNYTINNDVIKFDKILMESHSVNLAGQGTINVQNKRLALNFVTQSPEGTRVPVFTTIIDAIRGELLQLSITGTLSNPRINPVPLSPIANTLEALLPKTNPSATNP